MKITSISYRELRTGRNFNNTALEATAQVRRNDDPESVMQELKAWVGSRVRAELEGVDLLNDINEIRREHADLERKLSQTEMTLAARKKFNSEILTLAKDASLAGVKIPSEIKRFCEDVELPF